MFREIVKKFLLMGLLALVLIAPGWASAQPSFSRIVVFGTSLSDSGNLFALSGKESTVPYDMLDTFLIPDWPYAKGGHHFSNGATWIEQFGISVGMSASVNPAFQDSGVKGTNYAVGSARARDDGNDHINLSAQVGAFLKDVNGKAPSDALYSVEIGANDLRDALVAFATGGDGGPIIAEALTALGNNIGTLYGAGARKFLVWNAPNIGLTPAIRILGPEAGQLAGFLAQSYNANLDGLLAYLSSALPGIEIKKLDAYKKLNDMAANGAGYGLSQVEAACVTPNVPPFECQTPDQFLFWDGIHPTKAVHAIMAQEAAFVLGNK